MIALNYPVVVVVLSAFAVFGGRRAREVDPNGRARRQIRGTGD